MTRKAPLVEKGIVRTPMDPAEEKAWVDVMEDFGFEEESAHGFADLIFNLYLLPTVDNRSSYILKFTYLRQTSWLSITNGDEYEGTGTLCNGFTPEELHQILTALLPGLRRCAKVLERRFRW